MERTSRNHNTSVIKSYVSNYATIKNNHFYDSYVHVYIKGGDQCCFDVGNNYFEGGYEGIRNPLINNGNKIGHVYHDNLLVDVKYAIHAGTPDTSLRADDIVIKNNTFFYSSITAGDFVLAQTHATEGSENSIYNNIFYVNSATAIIRASANSKFKEADHNLFYNTGSPETTIRFNAEGVDYTSLRMQLSGRLSSEGMTVATIPVLARWLVKIHFLLTLLELSRSVTFLAGCFSCEGRWT